MPLLYERHDTILIPRGTTEGMSLSTIEVFCSGKVLVRTQIGRPANLVVPAVKGSIADLTIKSLAGQIEMACEARPGRGCVETIRSSLLTGRWRRQLLRLSRQ